MDQLEAMRIFLRVAELSNFSQAAETLGLTRSAVSMAVQRLEALVGAQLLQRTTRQVQLTPDGAAYFERSREIVSAMEDAQTMFKRGTELEGVIRADMSLGLANKLVLPRLPEFLDQHPGLHIEISSTDRKVDVIQEGFDFVIRAGAVGDDSLVARQIGQLELCNCASPGYVSRYGLPVALEDLKNHRLIHYVTNIGAKSLGFEVADANGASRYVPIGGSVTVNNSDAYLTACLAGLGIIQTAESTVRPIIKQGALVEILPSWSAPALPITVVYPSRTHRPKRVQVFMNWVIDVVQHELGKRIRVL